VAEVFYNHEFHERHLAGSLASARVVLPILFKFYQPESIIDVGCGLGSWLKTARDLGVRTVMGLDGDRIEGARLLIDECEFQAADLSQRIAVGRRFDLAISLEVAEHLPFSRSESFVADLTALSDVVLFSAAAPYQGGTNHINEQWLEFWGILFRRFGYIACDALRPHVWGNPAVEFWYRQNLLIFCKPEIATAIFPGEAPANQRALSFTHPLCALTNAARYRPLLPEARELECLDYEALAQAYLSGDTVLPPLRTLEAVSVDQTRLFPEARIRVRDAAADVAACHIEIARLGAEIERVSRELENRLREIHGLTSDLNQELAIRNTETARFNTEAARFKECIARLQDQIRRTGIALAARNREALSNQQDAIWRMATRLRSLRAMVSAKARNQRDVRLVMMSGLFDRGYYLSQHSRLEELGLDPVCHYVEYGAAEGSDPNPRFDTSFYLETNPDVARSRMNPLAHYHAHGGAEGRDPHPSFKTSDYLAQNPEVLQAGMTPLLHYLVFGNAEDLH
jgi:hypothetical protein